MQISRFPLLVTAAFLLVPPGHAQTPLHDLAATIRGPVESQDQIQRLRAAGPAGLQALLDKYPEPEEGLRLAASREPISIVIDQVAAQRDARASRLYWYTDQQKAQQQAAALERPILSLRLLGDLSDDLSCANSRYFRTVLYANKEVSNYLRENYVLHWASVRKVPVIIIDFGDERKVQRTITGNSIHYILDSQGRIVDALPGLYGPGTFLEEIQKAAAIAKRISAENGETFAAVIASYHKGELQSTDERRQLLLSAKEVTDNRTPNNDLTLSPIPSALTNPDLPTNPDLLKLSAAFTETSRIDDSSRALINRKNASMAMLLTVSKFISETPMFRMTRNLEYTLALDTAINEFELRPQIRQWLVEATEPQEAYPFNERVYAEIFRMPRSDQWLGLLPPDVYAALDGQGITDPKFNATQQFDIGAALSSSTAAP